jgi:hypothetical protein
MTKIFLAGFGISFHENLHFRKTCRTISVGRQLFTERLIISLKTYLITKSSQKFSRLCFTVGRISLKTFRNTEMFERICRKNENCSNMTLSDNGKNIIVPNSILIRIIRSPRSYTCTSHTIISTLKRERAPASHACHLVSLHLQ